MFGNHRRKRLSCHPSSHSTGAVWRGPSALPTGTRILSSVFYFYFIFCSYNSPKLMSEKNCSFNYSLLLINYLKINIMLLFPSLPFFHYLSNSCCSLILGVFHDTLMAPAAQQSLSQCNLSPALPSISPSHLSGLGSATAPPGPLRLPQPLEMPQILHFSSLGANLVLTPPDPYNSGLRGHNLGARRGEEQVLRCFCCCFTSAPCSG